MINSSDRLEVKIVRLDCTVLETFQNDVQAEIVDGWWFHSMYRARTANPEGPDVGQALEMFVVYQRRGVIPGVDA